MQAAWQKYFQAADEFIPGNTFQLKLATCALLAGKHCLIEDTPGKGKTLLAKYLGKNFELNFKRIQCTNDLMPSDVVGFHQWLPNDKKPILREGPLFADLVLVDEINRASARTQSSLLQAMEEKAVTIDDQTYPLNANFVVIATQNPHDHVGTAQLPESQIDRFLFKFNMGNLNFEQEFKLIQSGTRHEKIKFIQAAFSHQELQNLKQGIDQVSLNHTLYQWITLILQKSRQDQEVKPLSSRAGLDFVLALKCWAIIHGRNSVLMDDFSELFAHCFAHRLFLGSKESHAIQLTKSQTWLKQLSL